MDNRNEPTDMDIIDSPRRTPTPPLLSASQKRAPHQGCTERTAPQLQGREEIQADLEELGLYPEKVNQLIGRRSKQPIPVFLVTLPRDIENLKFSLKNPKLP
ncbi:hypothetical protein TNCV_2976241 [Trichonephila clavipes]|nr:hypothetical protein TNCV_2976241 [Trichonephila clavipes]